MDRTFIIVHRLATVTSADRIAVLKFKRQSRGLIVNEGEEATPERGHFAGARR